MAELALTNQGVGIGGMVDGSHGRGMAHSANPAAIISCCTAGRHGGDAPLVGRRNQYALQVCIEGVASPAGVVNFTVR